MMSENVDTVPQKSSNHIQEHIANNFIADTSSLVISPNVRILLHSKTGQDQSPSSASEFSGQSAIGERFLPLSPAPPLQNTKSNTAGSDPIRPIAAIMHDDPKRKKAVERGAMIQRQPPTKPHITIFAHLQQWERGSSTVSLSAKVKDVVHPVVIRLGLRFLNFPLLGAVERCRAMLRAFQEVIGDYVPPEDQLMSRHLDAHLKPVINYLAQARPLAVSQSNAIRHVKGCIARLDPDWSVTKSRAFLLGQIEEYIEKRIDGATRSIVCLTCDKLADGDVIMIYSRYTIVSINICPFHHLFIT